MIDKEYGKFILVCDICGHEVKFFYSFDEEVDYKKDSGWKSRKARDKSMNEGWIDVCPKCLDER